MTCSILMVFTSSSVAQKEYHLLRQGNQKYDQGKYKEAELDYRKAIELKKDSYKGQFNLGTSLYKQQNWDESSRIFGSLAESNPDKKIQSNALHNLGNTFLESKQYEKSVEAYENSLLKNPSDKDTKYNLEYARQMLRKQKEQQQQNEKNKKNQDNQDKKDKKDQNKEQQNKEQAQNKNQQDQNKKISKEDADRMLEALKNNEKKTLAKLNKEKHTSSQIVIEKDW
ncbi:MAG: tetratricopeptide repeat protein [Bacteroidetes bacterium]|nr:tetratricopeptide repeat protein [Bacteroidota bacterium]